MPAVDASQSTALFMTVKLHPEWARHNSDPGGRWSHAPQRHHQKQFQGSNYRFELDGVNAGLVNKVESFTIKQGTKLLAVGSDREYQLEPTTLEYPNITFYTALAHSAQLFEWHKKFVIDGDATGDDEITGSLTYLSTHTTEELLDVTMSGVGITNIAIQKNDANNRKDPSRIKVELYV